MQQKQSRSQSLKSHLRKRLMMGKTDLTIHRDNFAFLGVMVFLFNAFFATITEGVINQKSIIEFTGKSIFSVLSVEYYFRQDFWYVTVYLAFCFFCLSIRNSWFLLGFCVAFVRLIYNCLIMFHFIGIEAGYSAYLNFIIFCLFLIFEGAEWKYRLNIF